MSDARRIGVFGGTFDPIHETHLAVARAALEQAQLDEVLFVVASDPPHKRNAVRASAEDRHEMVAAALAELCEPRFRASRIEIDRGGPSYTSDTLSALSHANPGAEIYFIIGADALIDLPKWHDPQGILRTAKLLVVPRPGFDPATLSDLAGRYTMLDFPEVPVSSTDLRAQLAGGRALDDVLPAATAAIIQRKGLYRAVDAGNA